MHNTPTSTTTGIAPGQQRLPARRSDQAHAAKAAGSSAASQAGGGGARRDRGRDAASATVPIVHPIRAEGCGRGRQLPIAGKGGQSARYGESQHRRQEQIGERPAERNALKINSRRQRHAELHDCRNQRQGAGPAQQAQHAAENSRSQPLRPRRQLLERLQPVAQRDTFLGGAHVEVQVAVRVVDVLQRAPVRLDRPLQQGNADCRDQRNGQERHLEPGVRKQFRLDEQETAGGRGDNVERLPPPKDQRRGQKRREHHRRAGGGQLRFRQGDVAGDDRYRRRRAQEGRRGGEPQGSQQNECQQADVQSGNHQRMIGARSLKGGRRLAFQQGAVAEQQRRAESARSGFRPIKRRIVREALCVRVGRRLAVNRLAGFRAAGWASADARPR